MVSSSQAYARLLDDPLVFVLAQVRFAPILMIEKVIPAIQDDLRRRGFPRFKRVVGKQLVLGPAPEVIPIQQWVFADRGREAAVVVAQDFVVLETSNYDIYSDFSASLKDAINIVREHAEVELVERLGLRYVDLIRPNKSGGAMGDYLRPGLRGPDLEDLQIKDGAYRFESRSVTEQGNTVVVKLSDHNDGTFLPADVDGKQLSFDVRLEPEEHVALLDIDHFTEEPRDYNTTQLLEQMEVLHASIKKTFVRCVTKDALERWKMEGPWSVPE